MAALPLAVLKEQILVALEPEQRHRLERALLVLAEQDREFALRVLELGREQRDLVDAIALLGAVADRDLEVVMVDIVEGDLLVIGRSSRFCGPGIGRHGASQRHGAKRRRLNRGGKGKRPLRAAAFLPLVRRRDRGSELEACSKQEAAAQFLANHSSVLSRA
jgi:hypothetical protein